MITVAVIDTGVDIYHNKLYKYINLNLSKSFVDESLTDKNGHGTAITGIILYNEKFKESLKNVQLVICKITNQLTFEVEKFIEALEYAISIGVHIINLSLSIKIYNATQRQMDQMKVLIQNAYNKNIIVVVSTGNQDHENNIFYKLKDFLYPIIAKDVKGNIASYSKSLSNSYAMFGGDIESIGDSINIEKHLAFSTFPMYLENSYFNYFGVKRGYSYFWGTSIATAKFTHIVINALQINNDLPISISSKLKKYIHKPD